MIDIRSLLLNALQGIEEKKVALYLSAGVDSTCAGLALEELGHEVHAYTFMLDGKLSTDFSLARKNAKRLGWEFTTICLPTDIAILKSDILHLKKLGAKKKTEFEAAWLMVRSMREMEEKNLICGHAADGYFALSKKAILHHKHDMDAFRCNYFANPLKCQNHILSRAAKQRGKVIHFPYLHPDFLPAFKGTTWDQLNKPKQKMCIRQAYPQLEHTHLLPHTNLQKGDSGISDHFEKLLRTDWNKRNAKSVVSIYNDLVNGRIQ